MTALARTAPDVLRCAAHALRTGEIRWGRDFYISPLDGCRCALGALTYAADPDDTDGDPEAHTAAWAAMYVLADYLVTEQGACRCMTEDDDHGPTGMAVLDPVETVGGWNDAHGRTVDDVIAALEAAALRAAPGTAA